MKKNQFFSQSPQSDDQNQTLKDLVDKKADDLHFSFDDNVFDLNVDEEQSVFQNIEYLERMKRQIKNESMYEPKRKNHFKAKKSGKKKQSLQEFSKEEQSLCSDNTPHLRSLKQESFKVIKSYEDSVDKKIILIIKYQDGSLDSFTNLEMEHLAPYKLLEYYEKKITLKFI